MRRVLVDHARGKHRQKRGGGQRPMLLSDVCCTVLPRDIELLALDEALEALAAEDPTDARIVEMRFFAGMKVREIAAVLEVNEKTVQRRWNYAKARLQQLIGFEAGTAAPKKPPSGAPWSGRSSSPSPRRIDARAPTFLRRRHQRRARENLRVSPGGLSCSRAFA